MTVLEVNPLFSRLDASRDGHRTYRVTYQAITNTKDDGPLFVANDSRLPAPGDPYSWADTEQDQYARCMPVPSVRLVNEDQSFRRVWLLEYEFSTNIPHGRESQRIENPVNLPWQYESDSDEWEEEAFFANDMAGNYVAMTNTALEPMSSPVTTNKSRLSLKRNFASINQLWITYARNSVNASPITIMGITYGARCLFMRRLAFTRERSAVGFYYPVSFTIDVDPNTHDLILPNKGFKEKRDHVVGKPMSDADVKLILGKADGRPLQVPVYLDEFGVPVNPNANGDIPPTFRRFRKYFELSWEIFGFPPI